MTITAQSIIQRVAVDILVDPTSVRWPISELARFFNDGQRHILIYRPDALLTTGSIALSAGTRQVLASTASKLRDVIRNTGGNKRAITPAPKDLLDLMVSGWHNLTGVTEILHYTFDPADPRVFYVYPPAAGSGSPSVEAVWSALPTDITEPTDGGTYTNVTGNLSLPDIYQPVMQDYIAARCYSKDSEYASNSARAQMHMGNYGSALGVEFKATSELAPVTARNLRANAATAAG